MCGKSVRCRCECSDKLWSWLMVLWVNEGGVRVKRAGEGLHCVFNVCVKMLVCVGCKEGMEGEVLA